MKRVLAFALIFVLACSGNQAAGDDFDLFRRADPYFNRFIEPDGALLWRLKPGVHAAGEIFGKESEAADVEVGSLGLRGGDPEKTDAPRVLCLGDSVTLGYEHSYPEFLETQLSARIEGGAQVLNAGVPGYSLEQLRRRFSQLESLRPDVVVILVGWNDAKDRLRGYTDVQLMGSWLSRILARFRGAPEIDPEAGPLTAASGCCRVMPEQFRAGLLGFLNDIRDGGASAVLATYPSVLSTAAAENYPLELVQVRQARMSSLNQSIIDSATALNVPVVDFAADAEGLYSRGYFRDAPRDPIHPSEAGARELARRLAPKVAGVLRAHR